MGRALAELFLTNGWPIGLLALLNANLQTLQNSFANAAALPADVKNPQEVEGVLAKFAK